MIPKFRAAFKNKILGEVGSIDFVDKTVTIPVYDKLDGDYLGDSVYGLNQVTLMQSTGKMDSTGQVEVYAGDILYYPDQDEDNYGIIKFDKDTLAFVLDNGYERFVYGDYGMGKVIGNIYENPELVEGLNEK
ncbi:YopX family protein [Streptococcus suis]|uniref:YopX family protein n=1 Tax=Streptococcus suis TaxID=1307 RepID=UPI0038BC42A2